MKTSRVILLWVRSHNKHRRYPYGQSKYTAYEVELHVPHCFYSEIQTENNVWDEQKRFSGDNPKLCEMKGVSLIEGKVCKDHIHMYVAIPPKLSVSDFMSYLKGKSALMFFDRHPELRPKYVDRHFWVRGYYVATVGNVNEETIRRYIREQEENDKVEDGIK